MTVCFKVVNARIQLINFGKDVAMFCRGEDCLELLPLPIVLEVVPHLVIDGMIFLDLLIEGEDVLDLYVGEGFDEALVAGVVGSDVLMDVCLALLEYFGEQTSNLAALHSFSAKIFNECALAGLLDGAGSAIEQVRMAVPVLCGLIRMIVA